uniref:Down syndrome cell adhesion molecule-like protein Dscam2 n=1 Tax=Steinernema glaseri TaxID=37863 RepID=A0A1I7ZB21_9BILA
MICLQYLSYFAWFPSLCTTTCTHQHHSHSLAPHSALASARPTNLSTDSLGRSARYHVERRICTYEQALNQSYSYSWLVGGSTERFVSQSKRVLISMDGSLYFSYTKKSDDTRYACSISVSQTQSGQYGPFFRLVLPSHPQGQAFAPQIDEFQPQILPEIPVRGQTVYLECFAYGFPAPSYKWTRVDGGLLPLNSTITNYGRVLRIDNAQFEDGGRYKCSALNDVGVDSAEVYLNIHAPPALVNALSDQMIGTNETVQLECDYLSPKTSPVEIEWFRNGMPIVPLLMPAAERKRFVLKANRLTIKNTQRSDSAVYQCIVSNSVGSATSSALITVKNLAPVFHGIVFPKTAHVVVGTELRLPCIYHSVPEGRVHWKNAKTGEFLSLEGRVRQLSDAVSSLAIDNVSLADEGAYECWANNGVGEAKATVHVSVLPRPSVKVSPSRQQLTESVERVNLTCEVELSCADSDDCPEVLFDWYFNDHSIRTLPHTKFDKRTRWEKVRRSNKIRQRSEIKLLASALGEENVGRYSCKSIYGSGSTDLDVRPTPSVPTHVRVFDVTSHSVKLAWRQPSNQKRRGQGQSLPVDAYRIEYRTSANKYWQAFKGGVFETTDRIIGSYLLHNLDPGQSYQFRIRSRTEDGVFSAPSKHTEWVDTKPAVPSRAVKHIKWRTIDDKSLLVEWDPLEAKYTSGPNLRYNISWSDTPSEVLSNWTIVPYEHHIIEMSNATDTECSMVILAIQPLNDIGSGPTSTNTVAYLSSNGPFRQAEQTVVAAVNSTHLKVYWQWNSERDCENVLGGQVSCRKVDGQADGGELVVNQSVPASYTHWTIGGLQPETEYSCMVTAFDQYGRTGPPGKAAVGRTMAPAPSTSPVIRNLRVQSTEDGFTTVLDWSAISLQEDSSNATYLNKGYKVYIFISETAAEPIELSILESALQDPLNPSARIDGLKIMHFYSVQVAGFNDGGVGPLSSPSSIRLGLTTPDAGSNTRPSILVFFIAVATLLLRYI